VALSVMNTAKDILESQGYKVKLNNKTWSLYAKDI
jgi:hypothetical protein